MFYLCAYPNQQQCHKRKRFVELIGHPICHSNEVTICPLLKIETAAKAKEKDRKEEMTVQNFHGMLTQTIWQTLNMPIRGETNYSGAAS